MNPPLFLIFQDYIFRKTSDLVEVNGDLKEVFNYEQVMLEDVRAAALEGTIQMRNARSLPDCNEVDDIFRVLCEEQNQFRLRLLKEDIESFRDKDRWMYKMASRLLDEMNAKQQLTPTAERRAEIDRVRELFKLK